MINNYSLVHKYSTKPKIFPGKPFCKPRYHYLAQALNQRLKMTRGKYVFYQSVAYLNSAELRPG